MTVYIIQIIEKFIEILRRQYSVATHTCCRLGMGTKVRPRADLYFGLVNHIGIESAQACPLWLAWNEYLAKAGRVNRHITWYTSPCRWSHSVRWCLAVGLACRDQCWHKGRGSTSEACSRQCAIQIHIYFTLLLQCRCVIVWLTVVVDRLCGYVPKQLGKSSCSWYMGWPWLCHVVISLVGRSLVGATLTAG